MTPTLSDLDWPLRTERLELRPARAQDADAVWPWYRLPEGQEWTTTLSPTPAAHRERWESRLGSAVGGMAEGDRVGVGHGPRQDARSQTATRQPDAGPHAQDGGARAQHST